MEKRLLKGKIGIEDADSKKKYYCYLLTEIGGQLLRRKGIPYNQTDQKLIGENIGSYSKALKHIDFFVTIMNGPPKRIEGN